MDIHSIGTSTSYLYGARSTSWGDRFSLLIVSGTYFRSDYGVEEVSFSSDINPNARYEIDKNKNVCIIGENSVVNTSTTFQSALPMYLLANNHGGTAEYFASAKLYLCKIYDDGKIARDYVPCIDPNGEIGLYDFVEEKFYGNAGEDEFEGSMMPISGTWNFYLVPSISSIQNVDYFESVSFVSNGINFKDLLVTHKGYYIRCMPTDGEKGDEIYIYDDDTGWLDTAYRTIIFDGIQTVSKEFYDWFTANATQQEQPIPTEGLTYTLSNDGTYYTCTGIGIATDTDIVIANEIDGIPVTSIGNNAFRGRDSLTSIVIPNSVTSIGGYVFDSCSKLTSITFSDTSDLV